MRSIFLSLLAIGLIGCGSQAGLKQPPTTVTGKLSKGGQPVGNIVVVFQPLGDGHVKELPVGTDGSFQGEFISGEYAYYVAKPAVAAGPAASPISPEYFQPQMARTVTVEPGTELAIELN